MGYSFQVRYSTRSKIYREGRSCRERIEEKSRLRAVTSDNWEICVCVLFGQRESRDSLSYIIFFYVYVCVSDMFQGKEKLLDEKWGEREWMSCCCCWPLYTWKWTTCAFSNLFLLLLSAPGSCSTRGKIKKERKTLQFFSRLHTHWRMAFHWKGCWLAGLSVSIVICSSSLYDRQWLPPRYITRLFFFTSCGCSLSPSFNFSPPVFFRPENGPHSLPDTFFYSKRWLWAR